MCELLQHSLNKNDRVMTLNRYLLVVVMVFVTTSHAAKVAFVVFPPCNAFGSKVSWLAKSLECCYYSDETDCSPHLLIFFLWNYSVVQQLKE